VGKDYLEDVKRIAIGFVFLIILALLGSTILSVWKGLSFSEAMRDAGTKVFFPKTGHANIEGFGVGIFYLILAFLSIGIIYYISENIVFLLLKSDWREIITMAQITRLKNHIIICGAGQLGSHAARELSEENQNFVIIENDLDVVKKMRRKGYFVIEGDCLNDDVLNKAGIKRCKALITALGESADNIFVTLSAKQLNPKVIIGGRADSIATMKKMKQAGADYVVLPEMEGANRLVEYVEKA